MLYLSKKKLRFLRLFSMLRTLNIDSRFFLHRYQYIEAVNTIKCVVSTGHISETDARSYPLDMEIKVTLQLFYQFNSFQNEKTV